MDHRSSSREPTRTSAGSGRDGSPPAGGGGLGGALGDGGSRRSDLAAVAKDGALKLGGSIFSDLLGFAFVLVATHGFRRVDAGRFFESMALILILSSVAKLGADTAFVRFIPRYRVQGRTRDIRPVLLIGFVPIALLAGALGLATYFFGPQIANVFSKQHPDALVPYLRVLSVFLPAMTVYAAALGASRGFGTIKPVVAVDNALVPGSRTGVAFVAAVLGFSALWLAISTGLTMTIGLVAILVWTYRLLGKAEVRASAGSAPQRSTGTLFGEFWRFAGPRGFASTFSTLSANLNTLLIGALALGGTAQVAVFAAASRFTKVGTLILVATFYVISPQISALLAKGERARAQSVYQVSTWWIMIGSWPVYLVLAVWAPLLMRVFGKGYQSGATALTIMSLAMLVSMACGPVTIVLLMGGHAIWNLGNTAFTLALNVALCFILIPHLGVTGAAIATGAAVATNNLLALVQVAFLMKLGTLGRGFAIVAAASVICFAGLGIAVRSTIGMSIGTFILFGIVSSALYLVFIMRFRSILELDLLWDTVVLRGRPRRPPAGKHRRNGSPGRAAPIDRSAAVALVPVDGEEGVSEAEAETAAGVDIGGLEP